MQRILHVLVHCVLAVCMTWMVLLTVVSWDPQDRRTGVQYASFDELPWDDADAACGERGAVIGTAATSQVDTFLREVFIESAAMYVWVFSRM